MRMRCTNVYNLIILKLILNALGRNKYILYDYYCSIIRLVAAAAAEVVVVVEVAKKAHKH